MAGVLSTLRPLAEDKKLSLRFEPPEKKGTLTTDQARFKQILYNLLSNAIKFTSAAGRVTVSCQWVEHADAGAAPVALEDAQAVRVAVRDNGIGIAPEEQTVIWDEFRQARPNSAEALQGTGLGLALTRKLVALLGGTIWLESTPGAGSTFTFVVPRQLPQPQVEPAEDSSSGDAQKNTRPLVLVVEDDPPSRKLLLDWLAQSGLNTAWAGDGELGLELARKLGPRLILLDIHLPKLDGWQVLTELKSRPETAEIPVVIVSITEDHAPAKCLDVQDFIVKPVERDVFLGRLRELQPDLFSKARPIVALIVEDDPATRKLLADILQSEHFAVSEATNGREALHYLDKNTPDVVFLDLLMPELDGFAVVRAVRDRPELKGLPILVVTSKDLTPEERQSLNGHIQELLCKQRLTPELLLTSLERLGLISSNDN
jgi:CheY-like chemotaxis protein